MNSTQTLRSGLLQSEAATLLGVTSRTLRTWRRDGYGPTPIRDGNRLLYDPAAVAAFQAGARS